MKIKYGWVPPGVQGGVALVAILASWTIILPAFAQDEWVDASSSTASNHQSLEGFAGAVGILGNGQDRPLCQVTLVARDWVLTDSYCTSAVREWIDLGANEPALKVYFPQAQGTPDFEYPIHSSVNPSHYVWPSTPDTATRGFGVIKLTRVVPEHVVETLPPVYLYGSEGLTPSIFSRLDS